MRLSHYLLLYQEGVNIDPRKVTMLRFASLVLLVALALAGCADDDPRLYADAAWKVRCPAGAMGCPQDDPDRQVTFFDGQGGHRISCAVELLPGGTEQRFSFDIELGGQYRMQLLSAMVPRDGGSVLGTGCRMLVTEGVNTYTGACGASEPSAEQPCQVNGITFGTSMDGYPQATANILCRDARNETTGEVRDVTSPGAAGASMSTAVRLLNCSGL